ncbi:sexual development activator VeA [Aspergillus clavatus NRRL 1]|uniref:Developmental and secondary metabolism regulator veA n=1 Tax=Aspergillus clavatus (strain ATCC 1007 / CBS 513.65 / DSM 816 / NCTC 3887 / NRRL 1 / QM 1276 / 107) TaxID=344612 RepID=A1CPK7_ASPCL|nr:sexual development activator VeA [Aspergillus clavatus NRRL 1]EAW07578.1 sexual development activator VeA [Aspergillus clavatus NRRL 1]
MATRAPLLPPANETENSVSRITREGKKITYKLSVMQQPERARACGAGAKSSADRRPVDPPPVVELRIFESDPNDDLHKTDITFAYNANFFLFATLDTARPMAHGRLAGPPTFPVLTGVPVAGVAYLDRPQQAGYFIFPDLSVRHEGRYRLSFHLYEEIKDAKDADKDTPMPDVNPSMNLSKPSAPRSHLNFRLEVKSVPFTVYSAKKFPGLATSTSLSRIIAEQGCRVRIRRDVRMRRRGEKRTDDYDFDDERVFGTRSDRYTTPDAYAANSAERARSTSISTTVDPSYPYGSDGQRRPSAGDYGFPGAQPYQRAMPPAPAPVPVPASVPTPVPTGPPASYQSHLSFGSTQAQYPAPQLPPTPQSATPTNTYSPHPTYSHSRNSSNGAEHEAASVGYPYPQPRLPAERPSYHTAALPPLRLEPPTKAPNMQPAADPRAIDASAYQPLSQPTVPRAQTPSNHVTSLPPLKTISGEYHQNSSQSSNGFVQSPSPSHDTGSGKRMFWETNNTSSKRSHDDTFGHDERPLHNGMRPDADPYPGMGRKQSEYSRVSFYADSRDEMAYKRANGRMVMKISPALP